MDEPKQDMDMGFTHEILPECHHICLIYDSEEQRRKIVSEYLAAGIRHGELVRYFADTTAPEEIRAWLSEIDIEPKDDDSFRIMKAENSYCPSGSFVPQQMLDSQISRYAAAKASGYTGSRVTGEMNWVLRGIPGSERLLEYETDLNMLRSDFPHVGICQYDARLFDGAMLFQVLQVHPYMIAQGQIVRNPFYIKPEEFKLKFQAKT